MGRKNSRVRERHLPRAAQPLRGQRRTPRAQFDVEELRPLVRSSTAAKLDELEYGLAKGFTGQTDGP